MFDPSLKKRKKKTVAFSEDPLGAEADPTQPAPSTIDDTTTNGEAVDMGPKTMHEQMLKQNGGTGAEDGGEENDVKMLAAGVLIRIREGMDKHRALLMGEMIG